MTPMTTPAIAPPDREDLDELDSGDEVFVAEVLVLVDTGEVEVEVDNVVVGDGDTEAEAEDEAEAASSFVKIWML